MGRGPVGAPAIIRYVNNSLASVDDVSGIDDVRVLIKTLTASSSATISFVNGTSDVVLDNTYRTYIFKFINIHPATNGVYFTVGFRDGSTNYDATKTTSYFRAYHDESDSATALEYTAGSDLAQGTGFQYLSDDLGNGNDESCSGELFLFNPSSTTFIKHFMSKSNTYHSSVITIFYLHITRQHTTTHQ